MKLTIEQQQIILSIENRAAALKTAMLANSNNAGYPIQLIDDAVKEFRQRLSM